MGSFGILLHRYTVHLFKRGGAENGWYARHVVLCFVYPHRSRYDMPWLRHSLREDEQWSKETTNTWHGYTTAVVVSAKEEPGTGTASMLRSILHTWYGTPVPMMSAIIAFLNRNTLLSHETPRHSFESKNATISRYMWLLMKCVYVAEPKQYCNAARIYMKQAEACFRSLTAAGEGGVMGLPALKQAARNAGVTGDDSCDQVLVRVLNKHATDAGGEVGGRCLEGGM